MTRSVFGWRASGESEPWLYSGPVRKILARRPDIIVVSLWAAILGGAIVRFVGIDFGLPLTIKSDEPVVVNGAIEMIERRSFEPDRFQWPNHLGIMATYLAYVFVTPLAHGMLAEQAISELPIGYFHLVARSVTATFGVAGIVLAYFIGKRFHRLAGLFAAAFVAFLPDYVRESHYATPDIVLTTTVLGLVLAAMVYVDKPRVSWLLVTSAITALAIMAKYPGALGTVVIAAVVIATAIRDREWLRIVKHGFTAVFAVGGFLFLFSPVLFTNRHQVLRALTRESRDSHPGQVSLNFVEKIEFYASGYFSATGVLLLLLAIAGLWYLFKNPSVMAIPLFVGVVFWVALSTLGLNWARWGMPMYITPIMLSALGAYFLVQQATSRFSGNRVIQAGVAVVLGFALLTQVMVSVATAANFLRKDVQLNALIDLSNRGITADNSVFEGYSPFFEVNFCSIWDEFEIVDGNLIPLNSDTEYVLTSTGVAGRFTNPDLFPAEVEFYRMLEKYPIVVEYRPSSPEFSLPLANIRIVGAIESMGNTALGASSGPVIRVFEVPGELRREVSSPLSREAIALIGPDYSVRAPVCQD